MEGGNSSLGPAVCRVCLCSESSISYFGKNAGEPLISPCHCKGTVGLYHKSCLEHWLSMSKTTRCEICKYEYEYGVKKQDLYAYFRQRGWREHGYRSLTADFLVIIVVAPIAFFLVFYCTRTAIKAHLKAGKEHVSPPEVIAMIVMAFFILLGFFLWVTLSFVYHCAQFRVWQARHKLYFIVDQLEEPTQYYNTTRYNETDGMRRPLIQRQVHWIKKFLCCGRQTESPRANVTLLAMHEPVMDVSPQLIQPRSASSRFVAHEYSPASSQNSNASPSFSQHPGSSASSRPSSVDTSFAYSSSGGSPATISLSTFRPATVLVHRPLYTSSPAESTEVESPRSNEDHVYDVPPGTNSIFSEVDLGSPIGSPPVSWPSTSPCISREFPH